MTACRQSERSEESLFDCGDVEHARQHFKNRRAEAWPYVRKTQEQRDNPLLHKATTQGRKSAGLETGRYN
jgi:hypothetical protein